MELPTVKPAELKYSRDVSLGKVKRWQITCCRSDSSHETELNQQIHTKRKVVKVKVRKWKWEAVSNLLPCCYHAKRESEHAKVKVRCSFQAVAMQKSESEREKVKVTSSFQAVAMQKSESESDKVKVRSSCQSVAMLLLHVVAMQKLKVNVR